MLLSATPALAQTVTAMWDPSPVTQQVTGYQVCVSTSSLSCNIGLVSVGPASTSYAFAPSPGVRHYVAIRATNAAGVSPFSSEVSFSTPSFAQPANQTSPALSAITPLNLAIIDPDGSPLTITHTGLPLGLSINHVTRQITGAPTSPGTYNVTVFVNDGLVTVSRSFTWVIGAPVPDFVAPTLTISSHVSGQSLTVASVVVAGEATDNGRGGRGITSVMVNGVAAAGGGASGNDVASWSRLITLSAGVNTITVEATDGAGNLTMQQISVTRSTQVCVPNSDFNGDCKSDLVWRNTTSGQIGVWYMNGTAYVGAAALPTVPDLAWRVAASADFNRDGTADLIWRNSTTGQNVVWFLRGTTFVGAASLPTLAGAAWQLAASADVNQDGSPDLIWRNAPTGQNVVWYFDRITYVGAASLPSLVGQPWELAASADVNQDGAPDLIWRNNTTGQNTIWYLNGPVVVGNTVLPSVPDLTWRLMMALDLNNDGATELIWRNSSTGANYVWYMNQTSVTGGASLPTVPNTESATWAMISAR